MSIKKDILRRLYAVFIVLCILGGLILLQVFQVQVFEGDIWQEKGKNSTRIDTVEGERGNMYSDDSRLMSTSLPFFDIRLDATIVSTEEFEQQVDSLAICLANFFKDKSKEDYVTLLRTAREKNNRYLFIGKNINFNDLQLVQQFPIFRKGQYRGGFIKEQKHNRVKPFHLLARRTIGYARQNAQPVGLEGSFDYYFRGTKVPRSMHKISGGMWVPIYEDFEADVQHGKDVYTTINMSLQDVVENALLSALKKHKAHHGCAVVMEVATGKIKAIANLGISTDSTNYWEDYNYAIGQKSEHGSTFKVISLAALLDDGYVTDSTLVNVEGGQKEYHGELMRDDAKQIANKLTVSRIMEVSSNVGISKLLYSRYNNNPEEFIDVLNRMRLTKKTNIEITGEPDPIVKTPDDDDWSKVTLPWMAIGYGVELTPLQLLTFFNAIANDGKMMKPYLVEAIKELGVTVKQFDPVVVTDQVCKPATAKKIQQILKGVVENGTAKHISSPNFSMACKTGTAKIARDKKGYDRIYQASIAGFFPADNPKYSCIVVINAPTEGGYYGGQVAAPIFKEIVSKFYSGDIKNHAPINTLKQASAGQEPKLPIANNGHQKDIQHLYDELGISSTPTATLHWVEPKRKNKSIELRELALIDNLVPRVVGMGLRDAMFILENKGLRVMFSGRGKVVEQIPAYGKRFQKGDKISIRLE